jgi:Yip1-like protein
MNDMSNAPIPESGPNSVLQTWMKALTRPNEQTFVDIASSPRAKASTAYLWVFVASLVEIFFTILVRLGTFRTMLQQQGAGNNFPGGGVGIMLISLICGAPLFAAIATVFFALGAAIIQWIAKMFKGRGTFDQLAYTFGAIAAPYTLISTVFILLGAIPFVGLCFRIILGLAGLYVLVLEIMAVKGVNQFGWGEAAGSVLIPGLVIGLVCGCLVAVSFSALLPLIRNAIPTLTP